MSAKEYLKNKVTFSYEETVLLSSGELIDLMEGYAASKPYSPEVARIIEERNRQIEKEGWTPEHDANHYKGELAVAAACYAVASVNSIIPYRVHGYFPRESSFLSGNTGDRGDRKLRHEGWYDAFPWEESSDKRGKHDQLKCLTIAGALIVAEMERITKQ